VERLNRSRQKLDTKPDLESQIKALEERIRESEDKHSAQKREIGDLQVALCELSRNIMALEKLNFHMGLALIALGILFISSMILVYNTYQGHDLFTSYYSIGKTYLNALLSNPIFHRLWV
jgi:uncharacterized coiled-coil protein SlyX